jgi:WhiB family redox-sensing transcriptional regulator
MTGYSGPSQVPAVDRFHDEVAALHSPSELSDRHVLLGHRAGYKPAAEVLPCQRHDPEMWFAEAPVDLERAKALCADCPVRLTCLAVAVERGEFAGVWGGQIFTAGRIVPYKRPRGRPHKHGDPPTLTAPRSDPHPEEPMTTIHAPQPGNPDRVDAAARRLYDAECALHAAHHSHVEEWIAAANEKLHEAVAGYLAALAEQKRTCRAAARHVVTVAGHVPRRPATRHVVDGYRDRGCRPQACGATDTG